jgi:hypothetical protein
MKCTIWIANSWMKALYDQLVLWLRYEYIVVHYSCMLLFNYNSKYFFLNCNVAKHWYSMIKDLIC